jgi:outer membrane protein assembly factor BamB
VTIARPAWSRRSRRWLTDGRTLLRVDPAAPAQTTPGPLAEGIAQLLPGLYASGVNSPTVRRLDPGTGREVRAIGLDEPVLSLVGAGDNVWATGTCGSLTRLADRHRVRVADVSQDLPSVAAAGSLWVADEVKSQVVRLDAATGTVLARTPFAAADPAFGLVAGQYTVWVLDRNVSRADPATNAITRVLEGADPLAVVVAAPPR